MTLYYYILLYMTLYYYFHLQYSAGGVCVRARVCVCVCVCVHTHIIYMHRSLMPQIQPSCAIEIGFF